MAIVEDNIKNTGVLIGLLTFIAYIKQYVYYKNFNVDISNYISLEEVFTPFLDDLALNILIVIVSSIGVTGLHALAHFKKNGGVKAFIYIMLYSIFAIIVLFTIRYNLQLFLQIGIGYVIVVTIYLIKTETKLFENYHSTHPTSVYILPLIIFIMASNIFAAYQDISNKQVEYKTKSYLFKFENDSILTDSNNIYIGRTEKNLFIDRKSLNKVSVYNTSDITYEEVKINH